MGPGCGVALSSLNTHHGPFGPGLGNAGLHPRHRGGNRGLERGPHGPAGLPSPCSSSPSHRASDVFPAGRPSAPGGPSRVLGSGGGGLPGALGPLGRQGIGVSVCPASLGCQGAEGSRLSPAGIYILIAVGAVMMFVGFLGCYGAIQESQCLLGTVRPWAGAGLRVRAAGPAGGRTGSSGGDRTPSVPDVELGAPSCQSGPADLPQNASSLVSPIGSQIPPSWTAVTSSSLSSSY